MEFEDRLAHYRQFLVVARRAVAAMEDETGRWLLEAAEAARQGRLMPQHPDHHRKDAAEPARLRDVEGLPELDEWDLAEIEAQIIDDQPMLLDIEHEEEEAAVRGIREIIGMTGCTLAMSALETLLRDYVARAGELSGEPLDASRYEGGERERLVQALTAAGMDEPFTKEQRKTLDVIRWARNRYVHHLQFDPPHDHIGVWLTLMPSDELDVELLGDIAIDVVEACGMSLHAAFDRRWA